MVYVITNVYGLPGEIGCIVNGVYENKCDAYYRGERTFITAIGDNEYDPDDDTGKKWFPCKNVSHCYHWKYCDICETAAADCKCVDRWASIKLPKSYIEFGTDSKRRSCKCFKLAKTCRLEWDSDECLWVDCETNKHIPSHDYENINRVYIQECRINKDPRIY